MSDHHKSSAAALAADDVRHGLQLWRTWVKLGWNDILLQYRRSLLGPFWLSASTAVTVISIGVVYAQIFRLELFEFMPFLCVGLLVWGYISTILNEAGGLFTASESYIKQIRLPYSLYVYKFIWSKIIVFAHNFFVYFGVIIYFQSWPSAAAFVAIPGFLLLTLNGALSSLYGVGALPRHSADRYQRGPDFLFRHAHHVEDRAIGPEILPRAAKSVFSPDRDRARAAAWSDTRHQKLCGSTPDHIGQCRDRRDVFYAISQAYCILDLNHGQPDFICTESGRHLGRH